MSDPRYRLAGLGAAGGGVTGLRRAAGAINHDQAAYLLAWLNAVLDGVATADPFPAPNATNPARSTISS